MKQRDIIAGAADQSVVIRIVDAADGSPEQGVEHDTAGVSLWYRREGATKQVITPAALAALDSAHADGGIEHIDDGYYRLDLADAAFATGVDGVQIGGTFTDMIVIGVYIELQTGSSVDDILNLVSRLSTGSAAINTGPKASPNGFVITEGTSEANDEDSVLALDGVTHDIEDDSPNTDVYYIFDVGGNGVPVSVQWDGFAQSQGDDYAVYAWNWTGTPAWEQVGEISGANPTTIKTETFLLTTAHVGTGANIGLVHLRFYSTDGTKLGTDRILVSYSVVAESVGYSEGAIWVDSAGTAGNEVHVNGTADNPCPWANAKNLSTTLGIKKFHIANGNTVTLDAATQNSTLYGVNWTLALASQDIAGSYFDGATITGIGTGATAPEFHQCNLGAVTLPPCHIHHCGFGVSDGLFTGGSAGQYVFQSCFSLVAGSGTPDLTFSGLGSTTGINVRGWMGGSSWTLDSDCTVSHEVLAGGGQTFTTGGADVELRGIMRAVTLVLSGAGTIQVVGVTGPIKISGTSTAIVNLYGVAGDMADSSVNTSVTNETVSQENINTEAAAALGTYDPPTKTEMDIAHALLATPAEVNAEVVDALNVDTYAEPGQGAPPSTASIQAKISYMFKQWMNKSDFNKTTGVQKLYDAAGAVVDQKATNSDDNTTFVRGKMGSGA